MTVFLAKLYCSGLRFHQVEMESEEYGDQKAEHDCEYVTSHNEVSNFVVKGLGIGHRSEADWVGGPDD